MTVYIALLRGINVGKAKRIAMADLEALLVDLGHTQPESMLNSGNLVFQSAGIADGATLARTISAAIQTRMNLAVPVIVLTADELDTVVQDNPFDGADPSRLLVAFTQETADLDLLDDVVAPAVQPPDGFHRGRRAAYLHCPNGLLDSPAGERLLGPKVRKVVTTRNWATTMKLQAVVGRRGGQARGGQS